MHLVKHKHTESETKEKKTSPLDKNIVVRRDFCGKKLTPEEFQEFNSEYNEMKRQTPKYLLRRTLPFIPNKL
jgi:hypothetical protein